jgi:hypothetical protein
MLPILATGLTWLRAFKGPCLALSLAGFVAGGAAGGWLAWKLQDGRVARSEARYTALLAEQTQAIADAAAKNVAVTQDVLGGLYEQRETLSGLAADVRRMSRAVSLCNATSAVQVPGPAPGSDGASAGGQPRPAADVLADLATESAERADRNAAQLNALIDWLESTRSER